MTKTELKKLVAEVMKESIDKPSYIVRADKFYSSRDPDAEKEVIYQIHKIVKSGHDDYDEELVGEYDSKEEADEVAARLNNKDSNLKENEEVQYVEYVRDMSGEVPFLMGAKKFEYVWAKYPTGKLDIGVYAFGEDMVYAYEFFRKMYNISEAPGVVKSPVRTSYHVDTYDLSRTSRDPDAEREDVYQVKRITSDVQGDDYDEELVGEYDSKEEADAVAARLNNKDSNLKENAEVQYVEFAREMYNISEDGGKPKNPVRKGKVSDKLEASTKSNNRYDGGVYLPPALRENDKETFTKRISGTVGVNGMEYDYSAVVTVNVVTTRQAHGEDHSEIDTEGADIQIEAIVPEPDKMVASKVDEAIYDDVHGRNMWDFVNESDMVKENDVATPVKAAKDWILDCAVNPEDEENITHWLSTATDEQVKKYVNRTFDGGWNGFLNTL